MRCMLSAKLRRRRPALGIAESVEARQREFGAVLRQFGLALAGLQHFGGAQARRAAEHDEVDQRVGAEPVRAMHGDAGGFAERHQAGHDRVGVAVDLGQHFAVIIGRDAAHVVVHGRQHRDRLLGHVDAGKNARALRNAGQALVQHFRVEVVEVKEDVILQLADAAALADLHGHGAETTSREARSLAEGA